MRYDAILWDVDNTLLDFPYSQRKALEKCLLQIAVQPSEQMIERYSEINDIWWKKLEKNEVTKEQLLTGRFEDFFKEFHISCDNIKEFLASYQENLGNVYAYMENSLEICESLKGKCRQYVITNGVTSTQLTKLNLSGFFQIMDDIFISEQIGSPKPNRHFFQAVLAELEEIPQDRILIVGDSLTSDIKGGYLSDIDTCWYNPKDEINDSEIIPTYTIRRLKEVPIIVEG